MRNDSSITNEHELAVAEEPTSTGNSIADIDKERIEKVQKAGLPISNAKLLEKKVIKPVSYIVDGMLAQGLTVVAGVNKGGKSFLALLLCLSVSRGTDFMGFPTKQGRCLYLALEDNESRLKERMLKILGDEEAPSELDFVTDTISRLGDGLYGLLEEYVKVFPETKLIVIDTFALIRGSKNKKEGDYEFDYRETHILKQLADKYGICILVITHTRKLRDANDVFNNVSGSVGMLAAADVGWVLDKKSRTNQEATLCIMGRDVAPNELALEFDNERFTWICKGDATEMKKNAYECNPVILTIRAMLKEEDSWTGTMSEMMAYGKEVLGYDIAKAPNSLSSELKSYDAMLREYDGIIHSNINPNGGTKGRQHKFSRIKADAEPAGTEEELPFH